MRNGPAPDRGRSSLPPPGGHAHRRIHRGGRPAAPLGGHLVGGAQELAGEVLHHRAGGDVRQPHVDHRPVAEAHMPPLIADDEGPVELLEAPLELAPRQGVAAKFLHLQARPLATGGPRQVEDHEDLLGAVLGVPGEAVTLLDPRVEPRVAGEVAQDPTETVPHRTEVRLHVEDLLVRRGAGGEVGLDLRVRGVRGGRGKGGPAQQHGEHQNAHFFYQVQHHLHAFMDLHDRSRSLGSRSGALRYSVKRRKTHGGFSYILCSLYLQLLIHKSGDAT